ncbi:hypothetical protein [Pseudomonas monteilii]|uniref:Uncharacterized protein n=1 Tax=Pseudomonas monteilii TaxID=76759 RepID=A0A399LZK1_9PSED|nr:hypothetical protein [Pseudomonas monteilii]RII74872.1 hypothetical protein D0894_23740 [Pseudomonas monteilii]
MSIDINHLTADELVDLNHRIIERLKILEALETHKSMMGLHSGARVSFTSPGGERIEGTVMKLNRKTVTVVTDVGRRWNVSPHLLSVIVKEVSGNVVDIRSRK